MRYNFGLGESSLDHRRREEFPAVSNIQGKLVTFVFHDQDNDIEQQVRKLEGSMRNAGYDVEYIHTGPVIRREEIFARYSSDERRKLLYSMLNFVIACPILYMTVVVDRKEAVDKITLSGKLAKTINMAISEHQSFFCKV